MDRIYALFLTTFFIFSSHTLASSDGAVREAEKLLDTIDMETALQNSVDTMVDLQINQNPALKPYKHIILEFFSQHMSYDSMKSELIEIYAEAFTGQELAQIRAFYTTPAGQKAIDIMPELMNRGGQLGAQRVESNIQQLRNMIQEEAVRLEQLQNSGQ